MAAAPGTPSRSLGDKMAVKRPAEETESDGTGHVDKKRKTETATVPTGDDKYTRAWRVQQPNVMQAAATGFLGALSVHAPGMGKSALDPFAVLVGEYVGCNDFEDGKRPQAYYEKGPCGFTNHCDICGDCTVHCTCRWCPGCKQTRAGSGFCPVCKLCPGCRTHTGKCGECQACMECECKHICVTNGCG